MARAAAVVMPAEGRLVLEAVQDPVVQVAAGVPAGPDRVVEVPAATNKNKTDRLMNGDKTIFGSCCIKKCTYVFLAREHHFLNTSFRLSFSYKI